VVFMAGMWLGRVGDGGVWTGAPWVRNCFAIFWLAALSMLTACGRSGEAVVAIALHPMEANILYVVTHNAVLKTLDGGVEWHRIFTGMSQSRVLALGIDPTASATIFLGTKDDGVYMSYDGGRHWLPRRTGLDDVRVTAEVQQVVFVPVAPTRVFLATAMGVFESGDGGVNWRKRMAGITDVLMVTTLAVDPGRPLIMYAGTSSGIYKTSDGARTWQAANTGLIPAHRVTSSRALGVMALAVDPQRQETLYAGTLDGLYKTVDGGRLWNRIGADLSDQFISAIGLDPAHPEILYVGGRAGIFKSQDGGLTWEPRNDGLTNRNVLSLAISQASPALLYVGTNGGGLFRSRNGAVTWESVSLTGR